jgi:O-6-methylguanine DNA methyltransferase
MPVLGSLASLRLLQVNDMETLYYSRMSSPVGPLLIGVSDTALVALEFDRGLPKKIAGQAVIWEESESRTREVRVQLQEYFSGKRRNFDLALDLRGTDFQKSCWNELLRIPYGQTRSYAEIARAVDRPRSFRAVGQANHYNPIAIIVPCHRVLAAGCDLGGYGGGLAVKAWLLRLEGAKFRERARAPEMSEQLQVIS